jgi:PadR family transcriptional regulator, regulatory protein PadR
MRLGEFEALVLTAVVRVGDGANGTAVYQEIEAQTEGRDVSLPAVHVTLRRLEDKGLLTSVLGDTSPRGGRPQRFFAPTADGARALHEFRAMWQRVWRGLELPDPGTL